MRTEKILVVEDDMIAQLTFRKHLEKLGFQQVSIVDNGPEAIEIVNRDQPDLIFMDIMIEGPMDGVATTRAIQAQSPVPIIYMTASTDQETYRRAMETKPIGFLIKPYDAVQIKERAEEALKIGKQLREQLSSIEPDYMLDLIYDTASIGMCVTDANGHFARVNKAYCQIYGYAEEELLGQPFVKVLPAHTREYAQDLHNRFIKGLTDESAGEWQVQTKAGDIRDVYVTAGRMITQRGARFKVTTITDITEEKQQLKRLEQTVREKEMYVREVHHQVKNNLNIVSGLLFLQAEKVETQPDIHSLFVESMQRIKAMSLIHEKLYRRDDLVSIDLKDYIEDLAGSLHSTFYGQSSRIALRLDLAAAELDIDKAISCGLVLNEIISNSFKYAFPDNRRGELSIRTELEGNTLLLRIGDDGIGLPPDFDLKNRNTLGMQLIHSLTKQLRGTLEIVSQPGVTFHLRFDI